VNKLKNIPKVDKPCQGSLCFVDHRAQICGTPCCHLQSQCNRLDCRTCQALPCFFPCLDVEYRVCSNWKGIFLFKTRSRAWKSLHCSLSSDVKFTSCKHTEGGNFLKRREETFQQLSQFGTSRLGSKLWRVFTPKDFTVKLEDFFYLESWGGQNKTFCTIYINSNQINRFQVALQSASSKLRVDMNIVVWVTMIDDALLFLWLDWLGQFEVYSAYMSDYGTAYSCGV